MDQVQQSFCLKHADYVHDVAFDLHAQRIATCSSDQKIRIWERIEVLTEAVQTTPWQCTSEVKGAHKGAVWRVCWADPEYGQIFASSGNDMKICIYKEKEQANSKVWENLWEIQLDENIRDIKFAPRFLGLVLSTVQAHGEIKFYAPINIGKLTDWQENMAPILTKQSIGTASCIEWNTAFDEPAMLAIGCEELKKDASLVHLFKIENNEKKQNFYAYGPEAFGQSHTGAVTSMSWAPVHGRSHHLLVTAGTDMQILVWKIQTRDVIENPLEIFEVPKVSKVFEISASKVCLKVSWNISGTCFTTSNDEGRVTLFQRNGNSYGETASIHPK